MRGQAIIFLRWQMAIMATLYLAGMGLCDEKDMPLRTIEILKRCENVFAENYTNLIGEGAISRLEKIIGKKIKILGLIFKIFWDIFKNH
jgi:precorrin-2 methylase